MKLQVLSTLTEAIGTMLLAYTDSTGDYDTIEAVLNPFGIKNVASLSDYITEAEFATGDFDDQLPDYDVCEQVGVWSKVKPAKAAVLKELKNNGYVSIGG